MSALSLSLIKIAGVLGVVVGVFAPLLVWAERRQSAMIQDRIGPTRAAVTLPRSFVSVMRTLIPWLSRGATLAGCTALTTFVALASMAAAPWLHRWGFLAASTMTLPWSASFLAKLCLTSAAIALVLRVGYAIHTVVVRSDGKITAFGTLHSMADALKFIFKEDFVPPNADKFLHSLAPIIAVVPALAAFTVIPFGHVLYPGMFSEVLPRYGEVASQGVPLQIASINVGILFIFAIAGTGVVGAAIAGYASDNKYSLLGGARAASQMVSYEVALGLTIVPAFMVYGSLRLEEMALWQHGHVWGIFIPPLSAAFILFFTASIAETKRIPFDLPEGESELVGGYHTEYSGMKFGMFFLSEFVEVVSLAALATILFFGGWDVPWLFRDGFDFPGSWEVAFPGLGWSFVDMVQLPHGAVVLLQGGAFLAKVVALIWFQLMVRWSLPRFRYDQVMSLCWKGLLPGALGLILITGALDLGGVLSKWIDGLSRIF